MDLSAVSALRELLASTEWPRLTERFGQGIRRATRRPGGLLVVGTPDFEPWHVTAHLDEEAGLAGAPELVPTLVRYAPPPDAPVHLAVPLDRLQETGRGEAVLVVAPDDSPDALLERLSDAKKHGATLLAVDSGDRQLHDLVHDELVVPQGGPQAVTFDTVTHLVTAATVATDSGGVRTRIGRLLDRLTGPIDE